MPAGDEGNRHARHGGLFQDPQLLVDGVPPPTLHGAQNLNSFDTARHSRKPRRTPSLSLCSGVRSKWGCSKSMRRAGELELRLDNLRSGKVIKAGGNLPGWGARRCHDCSDQCQRLTHMRSLQTASQSSTWRKCTHSVADRASTHGPCRLRLLNDSSELTAAGPDRTSERAQLASHRRSMRAPWSPSAPSPACSSTGTGSTPTARPATAGACCRSPTSSPRVTVRGGYRCACGAGTAARSAGCMSLRHGQNTSKEPESGVRVIPDLLRRSQHDRAQRIEDAADVFAGGRLPCAAMTCVGGRASRIPAGLE